MKKLIFAVIIFGITSNSYADFKTYEKLQHSFGITKSSLIKHSLFLAVIGSLVYTYYKQPQETVVDHENSVLNFLDNTWCGNRQMEHGTIQEGNRSRPYIIEAHGIVGTGMKYFAPIASCMILTGLLYAPKLASFYEMYSTK